MKDQLVCKLNNLRVIGRDMAKDVEAAADPENRAMAYLTIERECLEMLQMLKAPEGDLPPGSVL